MFEHKSVIIYPHTNTIEERFPFELIEGFDHLKVETYSVSLPFLQAFCGAGGAASIEMIYGQREMVLTKCVTATSAVMLKHPDSRILKWVTDIETRQNDVYCGLVDDRVRLWTSRAPSHKKMFLLERATGERRAIVGSVNASISSVCGDVEECLVVFDEGPVCNSLFDRFEIKKTQSDRVSLLDSLSWLEAR